MHKSNEEKNSKSDCISAFLDVFAAQTTPSKIKFPYPIFCQLKFFRSTIPLG